jgi:hypothetical protein
MQQWQSCKFSVQKGQLVGDIVEAAETAGIQDEVAGEEKVVGKIGRRLQSLGSRKGAAITRRSGSDFVNNYN